MNMNMKMGLSSALMDKSKIKDRAFKRKKKKEPSFKDALKR